MNCYLGMDIGTSGCKAVVFDAAGQSLGSAYREYNVRSPQPGWAELDSDEVIGKCLAVIAEAAAQAPRGSVLGLAISCQGEAFTPVDAQGRALAKAMVSSDVRAASYARDWSQQFGADRLYQITGHTAHPLFSLFKLLWLKDHEPEVWRQTWKFLCFEDLLQLRLGLDPAMSWPLAGRTMLFDVRRHQWSPEILEALGLPAAKLARVLPSGTVAGRLAPALARELNLAPEAVVVAAGHDQPCGALGAGVAAPGQAMYGLGTVECLTLAIAQPRFTPQLQQNNLCMYDHVIPGLYATLAYCLTGGNLLKWFRDQFGQAEVAQARAAGQEPYELLLRSCSAQPSSLLVLPYFTPSATPYFDLETPGAMLGLRLTTTRGQVLRALLEGVTLEIRLNLDLLESAGCRITELRATGGGARSDFLLQLKADVLNKPILAMNVSEGGCFGAALLCRSAVAGEPLAALTSKWVTTRATFQPRPEAAQYYTELFAAYQKLYPALSSLAASVSLSSFESRRASLPCLRET